MEKLHINNESHYKDFIALNEQWISEHFTIEEADRALAANPGSVIEKGGYILSLQNEDTVVGVCALFSQGDGRYELARLAVNEDYRRKGYGDKLIKEAFKILKNKNVKSVNLMSNTKLEPALSLYKKHGFEVLLEGKHPVYTRTNITMEKKL